jgi:hypothetical protein
MAYATISFRHRPSGRVKIAPIGFSWTTFFFGFFPALLRGHFIGALVIGLLGLATVGLSNLVIAFLYNKWFVNYLIGEGFTATSASRDMKFLGEQLKIDLIDEAVGKVAAA